jgi:multiple sugar transport system substrate-binding protein
MRVRRPVSIAITASVWLAVCLSACGSMDGTAATVLPSGTPAGETTVMPTANPTPTVDNSTLTIWLPPAFRPDSNSSAGNILNDRIETYKTMHPGLIIDVRVKAASGTGGMRDSLAVAAAAAPGALPDLVALDQSNLRAAAIKGLIRPIDGLLPSDSWDSLFPYAESMVVVDDQHYGLPFAGDAMVLAGTLVPYPAPQRWAETGSWTSPMFAPLGDSRASFLFFGYYAAGGTPMLTVAEAGIEPAPFAQVLEWLQTMQEDGVLSPRSTQIDSFESSFLAIENFGESSATLYSVASKSSDYFIGYLPTPDGVPFSLATGWSWAVATPELGRQVRASNLMAWLTDPQFLAKWSDAQGVFPPSRTALDSWNEGVRRALAAGVLERAQTFPSEEISAFAGPIFSKAAKRVLVEGVSPADAAQEAEAAIHP